MTKVMGNGNFEVGRSYAESYVDGAKENANVYKVFKRTAKFVSFKEDKVCGNEYRRKVEIDDNGNEYVTGNSKMGYVSCENVKVKIEEVNAEKANIAEEVPEESEEKIKKFYVIGYHYYDYHNSCCPAFVQALNETFEDFGNAINRAREFWDEKSDEMKGNYEEDYNIM